MSLCHYRIDRTQQNLNIYTLPVILSFIKIIWWMVAWDLPQESSVQDWSLKFATSDISEIWAHLKISKENRDSGILEI